MSTTAVIALSIAFALVFLIFTVAEIILVMKLFSTANNKIENLDKKVDEADIRTAKTISNLLSQNNKMLTLIQKFKKGVVDMHSSRQKDIDQILNFINVLGENIKQGMQCHNELVDDVYENFEEVFCDLYDGDCEHCYWRERCIGDEPPVTTKNNDQCEEKQNPFRENTSHVNCSALVLGPDGKKHELDLNKPESIEEIKKSLKSTGLPDHIIDDIVGKMIADVKKIIKTEPKREVKKNATDPIKLINPNAKIVKTLEKLYQQK